MTHKYLFPKCAPYTTVLNILNLHAICSGFSEVEFFIFPLFKNANTPGKLNEVRYSSYLYFIFNIYFWSHLLVIF